jgi:hypothetical protein
MTTAQSADEEGTMGSENQKPQPEPLDPVQEVGEVEDFHPNDPRLHPGGAHGSAVDPGMSSLHEEDLPGDPHHMP